MWGPRKEGADAVDQRVQAVGGSGLVSGVHGVVKGKVQWGVAQAGAAQVKRVTSPRPLLDSVKLEASRRIARISRLHFPPLRFPLLRFPPLHFAPCSSRARDSVLL